jgi:hypothetical protein
MYKKKCHVTFDCDGQIVGQLLVALLQGSAREELGKVRVAGRNKRANTAEFLGRVVVGVYAADHHVFQLIQIFI